MDSKNTYSVSERKLNILKNNKHIKNDDRVHSFVLGGFLSTYEPADETLTEDQKCLQGIRKGRNVSL